MPRGFSPGFAGGLARGFQGSFGTVSNVVQNRQQLSMRREQLGQEAERRQRQESQKFFENVREQTNESKEELLTQLQQVLEGSETREQAEQSIEPFRNAYQGLVMQQARLGQNILQSAQMQGFETPENVPTPAEKVEREMELFDSIVGTTLTAQEQRHRSARDTFAEEMARGRARQFFDDEPGVTPRLQDLQVGKDDIAIMNAAARQFGAGDLSGEEQDKFLSATQNFLNKRRTITDPDSGLLVTVRPELPPQIRDMLTDRGFQITGDNRLVGPGFGDREAGALPAPGQEGARETEIPEGARINPPNEQGIDVIGPGEQPETTIAEEALAGNLTGPVPSLRRFASRFGLRGQEANEAQAFFEVERRSLITALQDSPRFAQREREAIENSLELETGVLQAPTRLFDRLVGIDKSLRQELTNLRRKVDERADQISAQERRRAMDMIQRIEEFRRISMPPVFSSDDTDTLLQFVESNPPGTRFVFDPGGAQRPEVREIQ